RSHWARRESEGAPWPMWPVRSNRTVREQFFRITCGFPILGTIKRKRPSRSQPAGVSGGRSVPLSTRNDCFQHSDHYEPSHGRLPQGIPADVIQILLTSGTNQVPATISLKED